MIDDKPMYIINNSLLPVFGKDKKVNVEVITDPKIVSQYSKCDQLDHLSILLFKLLLIILIRLKIGY